jgi:hypothetical protein
MSELVVGGDLDTVLNIRGMVCGYINGVITFTPLAWVMYLYNGGMKTRGMQVLINYALYKCVRAIGIGEGRGSTWPFGTQRARS